MSIFSKASASENAQVQKFQETKLSCFPLIDSMKSGKIGHTNGVTVFWTPSKRNETDLTLMGQDVSHYQKVEAPPAEEDKLLTQKQIAFHKVG